VEWRDRPLITRVEHPNKPTGADSWKISVELQRPLTAAQ
jgi:hypothetical protein